MPEESTITRTEVDTDLDSLWQVVLLDDDDHTYEYVVEMLMHVFGHPVDLAYKLTCEVDESKRVVVEVTTREKAESGKQGVHGYGADFRLARSEGSMSALIEPLE